MATSFAFRSSVSGLPLSDAPDFQPPSLKGLLGDWFIVLTSLPYWQGKRNIKATYSVLSETDIDIQSAQDDVTYQTLTSDKIKTVRGVTTPSQTGPAGTFDWRGSGLVKVVSNRWEVLAHGSFESCDRVEWILIHTGKSLFAPAAVHVYSRAKHMLAKDTRRELENTLGGRQDLKGLLEAMFEVQQC